MAVLAPKNHTARIEAGDAGLFAALFEATAPAKKPRAKKPAPTE